jgi:hypothetical protein
MKSFRSVSSSTHCDPSALFILGVYLHTWSAQGHFA